jgi:hypothetical protein
VLRFDAIRQYRNFQLLTVPIVLVLWSYIGFRIIQPSGQGALYFGEQLSVGNYASVRAAIIKTIVGGISLIAVATAFDTVNGEAELSDGDRGVICRLTIFEYLIRLTVKNISKKMFLFGPPIVVSAGAFYYTSAAPIASASLLLISLALVPPGVALGYSVGLIGLSMVRTADLKPEQETVLGFAAVFFIALLIINWNRLSILLVETPARIVGVSALSFVSPFTVRVRTAALGIVFLFATVSVSLATSVRLADKIWLGDAVIDESDDADNDSNRETSLDSIPFERFVSRRMGALVRSTWRVAARSPVTLVYAVPPLVVPLLLLIDPTVPGANFAHAIAASSVGVAAGSAVNLNIVDREGVVLPWILTTPATPSEYVSGKVLATGLPMFVVSIGLTGVLSALNGAPLAEAVSVVTLGCVYAVTAPAVAILFGVVMKDQSEGSVVSGGSSPPKTTILVAYNVCQLLICLPVFSVVSADGFGAMLLNTVVGTAVAGTAGYAAFLYAKREMDELLLPISDNKPFQL